MRRSWVPVVCIAVLGFGSSAAQANPFATTARSRLIAGLEDLADWCTKKKLLRTRNKLYERLIAIDPDHAEARKWLRYKKRGGKWLRPRPYREPKDYGREHLPAFRERYAALQKQIAEPLLQAIRDGPAQRRAWALEAAVKYAPDAPEIRKLNGEVQRGSRWFLEESVTAPKRREELVAFAAQALRAVPEPKKGSLTAKERGLGLPWGVVLRGAWWRGVATTDELELRQTLRACDASAELVARALPGGGRPLSADHMVSGGFGFYIVRDPTQGKAFRDRHPDFDERERRFSANLGGTWVPKSRYLVSWRTLDVGRRDGLARTAVGMCLRYRYGKQPAWVVEGFGAYLTYHLVGTRLTTFVERSRYARNDAGRKLDLWSRMQQNGADWLDLAMDLRKDGPPDLRFLFQKGLNQMDIADLLHSYSIAAFFLEGRPRDASRFLAAACGDGGDVNKALAGVGGLTIAGLNARVGRWLAERSKVPGR